MTSESTTTNTQTAFESNRNTSVFSHVLCAIVDFSEDSLLKKENNITIEPEDLFLLISW